MHHWKKKINCALCSLLLFFLTLALLPTMNAFAENRLKIGDRCSGEVLQVYDADTLLFQCDNHPPILVRLAGIDAPESTKKNKACWQQPFGDTATKLAQQRFLHQRFELEIKDRDQYHRWVSLLQDAEGHTANEWLVAQGLAQVYRRYPHPQNWEMREQQAQQNRKGLWQNAPSCIIPPDQWRHRQESQRCEQLIQFQQQQCLF